MPCLNLSYSGETGDRAFQSINTENGVFTQDNCAVGADSLKVGGFWDVRLLEQGLRHGDLGRLLACSRIAGRNQGLPMEVSHAAACNIGNADRINRGEPHCAEI